MPDKKEIIRTTVILVIICTITTAALAVTNKVTKNRIAALDAQSTADSMKEVLSAESYTDLSESFSEVPEKKAYSALDQSGKRIGTVYVTSAKGYGGDVKVMTGIGTDGVIVKVKVLDASTETPGLGQNATRPSFQDEFTGKSTTLTVKEDVDALTGATITSTAVVKAVNEALELDKTLGGAE